MTKTNCKHQFNRECKCKKLKFKMCPYTEDSIDCKYFEIGKYKPKTNIFKRLVTKRKDRKFNKQYHKACDMADIAAKSSKKKHCVVLTQDKQFVVVHRDGIKRINETRRKSKMKPTTWQEVLKNALYITR